MFGAVADWLSEAMDAAVHEATGLRGEGAAALTAVHHNSGLSVKELARFLRMRSPSAVELIDRLVVMGLMKRRPGADGRTRALELTSRGGRVADAVLSARRQVVAARLEQLDKQQRQTLHDTLASLLSGSHQLDIDLDHLCRRCDESVCTPARCPVEHGDLSDLQ
jgi:DNA-binding MarR family transcriptional regulator